MGIGERCGGILWLSSVIHFIYFFFAECVAKLAATVPHPSDRLRCWRQTANIANREMRAQNKQIINLWKICFMTTYMTATTQKICPSRCVSCRCVDTHPSCQRFWSKILCFVFWLAVVQLVWNGCVNSPGPAVCFSLASLMVNRVKCNQIYIPCENWQVNFPQPPTLPSPLPRSFKCQP